MWLLVLVWGVVLAPIGTKKNHTVVWSRNINRDFSEEELEKFFGVIDNKKGKIITD